MYACNACMHVCLCMKPHHVMYVHTTLPRTSSFPWFGAIGRLYACMHVCMCMKTHVMYVHTTLTHKHKLTLRVFLCLGQFVGWCRNSKSASVKVRTNSSALCCKTENHRSLTARSDLMYVYVCVSVCVCARACAFQLLSVLV
jgi:hypothetical protein